MTYEELKVDTIYTYNNREYKVLFKHDESKAVMIQNLEDGYSFVWGENYIKHLKPKVKPLPETGLLVHKSGSLIFRTGKESGYGFNSINIFSNMDGWTFVIHPKNWKPATKEDYSEFKELVIQHLKSLGFKDGDSFISLVRGYDMTFNFDGDISFDGGRMYLGGKIVFDGNQWIQPISAQNKLKKEIETRLEKVLKELEQTIQQLKKDLKE